MAVDGLAAGVGTLEVGEDGLAGEVDALGVSVWASTVDVCAISVCEGCLVGGVVALGVGKDGLAGDGVDVDGLPGSEDAFIVDEDGLAAGVNAL